MRAKILVHLFIVFILISIPVVYGENNDCDFFCWLANLFNFNFNIGGFDCADKFDKFMKTAELTFRGNQGYQPGFEGLVATGLYTEQGLELMDNHCFKSIKSWAYKSDYEYLIWNEMNWEFLSYIEQMYNHEVECPPNYDPICSVKELKQLQK